jgi:hypothetical protein
MCQDAYDFVGREVYTGSAGSPALSIVASPNTLVGTNTFGKGVTLVNTTWCVVGDSQGSGRRVRCGAVRLTSRKKCRIKGDPA